MKKIAVIGSGPMGLMCAYELLKAGNQVVVYEQDDRIGGMTASFDLGGMKIERFYHFICRTDYPLFDLLKEFNLSDKLVWRETKMGFYYQGTLYPWGDPISLLRFPKLDIISKFRYGLHVFYSKMINDWSTLDNVNAITWLKKWIGNKAYAVLWDQLFKLKFYEYQDELSAAWIGARIRRMAKSRQSIFKESLGYLQGGSDTLLDEMEKRIYQMGGEIKLKAAVSQVSVDNNKVVGVKVDGDEIAYDKVISTIPMPYVPRLIPDLPDNLRQKIASINNVGVACVVLKLKRPISNNFWMNITDDTIEVPGIIEYSNLNPSANHVVYVPYYMPQTNPKYKWKDEQFIQEVCGYLKKIKPEFSPDWIEASRVARYGYAQTVCSPGFYAKLPDMKTPINGLFMADTAFYYPEDRCISESVAVGKKLAELASSC